MATYLQRDSELQSSRCVDTRSPNKDTRPSNIFSLTLFIYSIKDRDRTHDHHIMYPVWRSPNKDTEETTFRLPMKTLSANNWHGKSRKSSGKSRKWYWHGEIGKDNTFRHQENHHILGRTDCYCKIRWNDDEEETARKETARIQQDSS